MSFWSKTFRRKNIEEMDLSSLLQELRVTLNSIVSTLSKNKKLVKNHEILAIMIARIEEYAKELSRLSTDVDFIRIPKQKHDFLKAFRGIALDSNMQIEEIQKDLENIGLDRKSISDFRRKFLYHNELVEIIIKKLTD